MAEGRSINVTEIIDGRSFGRFQLAVAIWCGFLVMLDGFDIGTTAYVVPVMAPLWQISPSGFAPAFLSTLVGVLIGTLAAGPLADCFGRKRIALAAVLIFGIFELLTLPVGGIVSFITVRFFTGLGIGALMPISIALTSEYAPKRLRTTITAIMYLGFPIGVGGGGFIAAEIISRFGWQSMFVIGGALPLLLLPFAALALPESIRFLVARAEQPARVAQLLNRLTRSNDFSADDGFTIAEERPQGFPVSQLFAEGRAVNTTLIWVAFFCNLLVIYFLNAWLPTVLKQTGVPLETTFRLTGALSWGGVLSILILSPIVDRLGAVGVTIWLYIGAALSILCVALSGGNVPLLALTIVIGGGCITASQSFINIIAATLYPTTIRSTGVAWALGIGRAGTMLGPVVGGAMLKAEFAPATILFSAAVPAAIAALAMLALSRRWHMQPPHAVAAPHATRSST